MAVQPFVPWQCNSNQCSRQRSSRCNDSNVQENADEKEAPDSHAEMETESERMRRYQNAEVCEVSRGVVYRHGQSETESETP